MPPPPPIPPYGAAYPPPPPFDPSYMPPRSRFPAGAIWMIALGVLFLLGDNGLFRAFRPSIMTAFFLIGFGVFLFVRRMTRAGEPLADDGTPFYRARLIRCLRGPMWIVMAGVLMLLNDFRILAWHRSWPLILILVGGMILLERTAFAPPPPPPYNAAYGQPYAPPYVPPAQPSAQQTTASAPEPGSSLTPYTRPDETQEGR